MDKARSILTKRFEALDAATTDVFNQIEFFDEQLATQHTRLAEINEEFAAVDAALQALNAAFPPPREDYDDIPF